MSNKVETFNILKGKIQENKDEQGYTVFDHLGEIFEALILNPDPKALEKFEEISHLAKLNRLRIKQPISDQELKLQKKEKSESCKWAEKNQELLKQGEASKQLGYVPDIVQEARMFQWAGVGFSDEDIYLLSKSVKKLAENSGCPQIRLWGKILGRERDYYVMEGRATETEEVEIPRGQEKRGSGVNQTLYWVSKNSLEDWVQLPDVRPEQVQGCMNIKYIFTGDLNAPVTAYPFFEGKERHLLRAQIARITHSTLIVPKGIYKIKEEEDETKEKQLEFEEEIAMPEDLNSAESWVHLYAPVLKNGRLSHLPLKEGASEEEEEDYNKKKEADPPKDPLMGLNEEEPVEELEKNWQLKVVGDIQQYTQQPPKEGSITYSINVIKSLRWPGAITVASGGKYASLYVGYGLRSGGPSFNPTGPPMVIDDPEDREEMPEPNPKDAPEEPLETDTQEEKKEEEEEED